MGAVTARRCHPFRAVVTRGERHGEAVGFGDQAVGDPQQKFRVCQVHGLFHSDTHGCAFIQLVEYHAMMMSPNVIFPFNTTARDFPEKTTQFHCDKE